MYATVSQKFEGEGFLMCLRDSQCAEVGIE